MSRAKRPYMPKIKGCYECSQRRIHCDRGNPDCNKCVSKGLECSGPSGEKYRFRNAFVPKPQRYTRPDCANRPLDRRAQLASLEVRDAQGQDVNAGPGQDLSSGRPERSSLIEPEPDAISCPPSPTTISMDHMAPWQRFLLKHFSDHIAPEMVIIDDCNNGWRHLVLPLACTDRLVLCSALAVAAFHFSRRAIGQHVVDPNVLYSRAIRELQDRKELHRWDLDTRYRVITSIVVLLVATMVDGTPDFAIIFRMLQSVLDIVGGEEKLAASGQAIADFSAKQIRKMRVYASPFISQDAGVCAVSAQAQQCWDGQERSFLAHPNYSHTIPLISNLRELSFQMYLQRASAIGALMSPSLLPRFKLMLESFPEAVEGEHVLVWPVFIAASASDIPEQQNYFAQFLERQFSRSGFVNITKGLESLRRIWARNARENWTTLLPEQAVFVM